MPYLLWPFSNLNINIFLDQDSSEIKCTISALQPISLSVYGILRSHKGTSYGASYNHSIYKTQATLPKMQKSSQTTIHAEPPASTNTQAWTELLTAT